MRGRTLGALTLGILAVSCEGACPACTPVDYTYPSKVVQGSEPVDDAVRARLTERGLDFLVAHFKDILRAQFTPDPVSPSMARFPLPSTTFVDNSLGGTFGQLNICLQGSTDPPPSGCVSPAQAGLVSAVTLDLEQLESKLTADFVNSPQQGVRLVARGLVLGLDGRIHTNIALGPISTDADCNAFGRTTLPPPGDVAWPRGTLGTVDVVADIRPRVSTDPAECRDGAAQCFMASVHVASASIEGVGLGVESPKACVAGGGPPRCSPACSDVVVTPLVCGNATECLNPLEGSGDLLCPDPVGDCECRVLFCPLYGFGTDIIGQLSDFLLGVMEPILDNLFTLALNQALQEVNGQPMSAVGYLDMASQAPSAPASVEEANKVGYSVSPTNNAFQVTCPAGRLSCDLRRGMDVLLRAGLEAVHQPQVGKPAPHPCAPVIAGPDFLALYGAGAFEAPDGAPLSGEFVDADNVAHVYDLSASLSRATLNQAGFALFNSGVLCLGVDSDYIHGATGGKMELTAGVLDLLTGGRLTRFTTAGAPLAIALAPGEPVTFTLGEGTPADPHIQLSMEQLHVSMYVYMYERYVRLFEVTADVTAGANATPDPVTRSVTVRVTQGPRIANFQQGYNELLPDVDWAEVLPSLLDVALGALLSQDLSFNFDVSGVLTQALGAPIYVVFEGLQTEKVGAVREYINLYLSLSENNPNPLTFPLVVDLQAADQVGTWRRDDAGRPVATGQARLSGRMRPVPPDTRYTYQVDFGPWHDFTAPDQDGLLTVRDGKLALVGRHVVTLRGMRAGEWGSLSRQPAEVIVWTDAQPPEVAATLDGDVVRVDAEDRVAGRDLLVIRWRVDGGAWSPWQPVSDVAVSDVGPGRVLEVQGRDPAANTSVPASLVLRGASVGPLAQGAIPEEETSPGTCACASPVARARPAWLALALLAVLVSRRRR